MFMFECSCQSEDCFNELYLDILILDDAQNSCCRAMSNSSKNKMHTNYILI